MPRRSKGAGGKPKAYFRVPTCPTMRTMLYALLAFLLMVAPTPQDEVAVLRELKRSYQVQRRPLELQAQREAALVATDPFDSLKVAKGLLAACSNIETEIEALEDARRRMVLAFNVKASNGTRKEIDGLLRLEELLHARLVAQQDHAARLLQLETALTGRKVGFGTRLALAAATEHWNSERRVAALEKLASKVRTPAQRASLMVAIEATGPPAAALATRVLKLLDGDDETLRVLAIRAIAAAPSAAVIEPLIARLEREEGRVIRGEVASALQRITRQRIGTSVAAWRTWLEREGGPFLAGEVPLGGGQPEVSGSGSTVEYHGLKLQGQRLVFAIDRSKSMQRTLTRPSRKPSEVDEGVECRIDRAREELQRTLGNLNEDVSFTIVTFAGDVQRFADELLVADGKQVQEAQQYVQEMRLKFGTAVYDALETSFYLAGRQPGAAYWTPRVDALVLLSDGQPIIGGKGDDKAAILRAVRRWNPLQRVQVSVVGLGDEVPAGFLRRLVEENDGQLVLEHAR